MSVTFTSTMSGANADYMRYLWSDTPVTKTDRYKDSTLLDFALVPWDSSFVKLKRGSYITVNSTVYPKWFTGYIIEDPELTYLGKRNGQGVWGYKYKATSDEYILSLKPLGILPPFLNVSMGSILKTLAERLCPGVFNLDGIQDGPIVAQYSLGSGAASNKFINVSQDLCEAASFRFYGKDKKLYFEPQDIDSGSVTLNGNDKHFTPSNLEMRPASDSIVNDVTVLGDIEPQAYIHEYFVGTGLDASFPLVSSVFGSDTSVLIDETFSSTGINSYTWDVYDTVQCWLQVSNGYLNCLGGNGTGSYDVSLQSVNPIPMDGRLRFTHGEWDFLGGGGVICGLWTGNVDGAFRNCLYGIKVNGYTLNPIVCGVVDTAQSVTVKTANPPNPDDQCRYVIRTLVEFNKTNRTTQTYNYITQDGKVDSFGGNKASDYCTWQTTITEILVKDGSISNQWNWSNTFSLSGSSQSFAKYVPVASDNLHVTFTGITVSVPIAATLENATNIPITNLSFDSWDSLTAPSGWSNPTNVFQDTIYATTGCSLKMESGGASIEQPVSALLDVNTEYMVICRLMRSTGATQGTFNIKLTGTGITGNGLQVVVSTIPTSWMSYTGTLCVSLSTIPSDLKLVVQVTGNNGSMWVDSAFVLSKWAKQMLGPNEIDAVDGLAPIATIVSSNVGSVTKSTYLGTPQYNPGQSQLVFFKDSVHRTSNLPVENQVVRLSYRSAGSAFGRAVSYESVVTESANWNDDGFRSIVKSDLTPRPRTSEECELAAAALVSENAYSHYDGTYTQWSKYFTSEPRSGGMLKFTNLDNMCPDLQAEEINQVVTTLVASKPTDLFSHKISFGKPDRIRRLLNKFGVPAGVFQTSSNVAGLSYVDVNSVGLNFAPDVTKPVLQSWDSKYLFIDAGQNLTFPAKCFEVRYTDSGWGPDDGKNLLMRSDSRYFSVPRSLRGRVFFIRQANYGNMIKYSEDQTQSSVYTGDGVFNSMSTNPDGNISSISTISYHSVHSLTANVTLEGASQHCWSFSVKGPDGTPMSATFAGTQTLNFTLNGKWQRLSVPYSGTLTGSKNLTLSCSRTVDVQTTRWSVEQGTLVETVYTRTHADPYGPMSRYSTCVHVAFPVPTASTTIDFSSGLVIPSF